MGNLYETVKSFLDKPSEQNFTSYVEPENVKNDLTDEENYVTGAFFDRSSVDETGLTYSEREGALVKQAQKIKQYRCIAMEPDVSTAIDSIVNEIMFSYDGSQPVQVLINIDNDKLKEAIEKAFQKVMKLINIDRNLYNIVKTGYVDGQIIFQAAYDEKDVKKGIQHINLIDPVMFYWNNTEQKYMYSISKDIMNKRYLRNPKIMTDPEKFKYSNEEIIRDDFGIHQDLLTLSYLEYALKPANILQTLEDLLVPLRFSRSISRRVFNVDIGDLPTKRGAEVMKEYQRKFQYKKFFNNETGEIANQAHITSMVEDYWFSNRSGGRGTNVETLDESGNLGELDDIIYYSKKLYRAMRLPQSRSPYSDNEAEFDYDTTRVSQEDMEFFMFISRLRIVYTSCFKDLLMREVISTGVMTQKEWEELEEEINVRFSNENSFIEKMKLNNLTEQVGIFGELLEYKGKLFSVDTILKQVFRYSDDQIKDEFEKIHKEEKDPLFASFYKDEEY